MEVQVGENLVQTHNVQRIELLVGARCSSFLCLGGTAMNTTRNVFKTFVDDRAEFPQTLSTSIKRTSLLVTVATMTQTSGCAV